MTSTRYWIAVSAIVLATLIRIASTHMVFAQTLDEPVHVAAGHEWLTNGTYRLDFEHPPLPRALFALPFLHDRAEHANDNLERGNDLFALHDHYIHNLARARRGNLLFVAAAAFAIAAIARRLFGDAAALCALVLFASLPAILAHGGLATTDMAAVAGFAVALQALLLWCDEPSWARSVLLGAAIAFGVSCKYSFVVFFPAAALVVLIVRRRFAPGKLALSAAVAFVLVWAGYRFEYRTLADANPDALPLARAAGIPDRWTHVRIPAPDLVFGFVAIRVHNQAGHSAFLLGRTSQSGWWYYFPAALFFKTPIPYLLLAAAGLWLLFRTRRAGRFLAGLAAVILLIAMSSRINIGVRHILPIYVPLSVIAGAAVVELWRANRAARVAVASMLLWLVASSALAHPDYIPWMNAFAGKRPYHVLLDSNYDWGQDIWRLAGVCHQRGITWLGYDVVTSIRAGSIGISGGEMLRENAPSHGWCVISEQKLELARVKNPHAYDWLERQPGFERIGTTLRFYHFP